MSFLSRGLSRFKRKGDRRHGNRNYTQSECSMEKLEEMQYGVLCDRRMYAESVDMSHDTMCGEFDVNAYR